MKRAGYKALNHNKKLVVKTGVRSGANIRHP
jgi:hypothetical protein